MLGWGLRRGSERMTSRDFCYWLQGYFEIQGSLNPGLRPEQVQIVQAHLAMVFVHEIDPAFGADNDKLDAIHNVGHSSLAEFYAQNPHMDPSIEYGPDEPRPRC